MKKARTFSDVCIIPKFSEISSRSKIDISVSLGPYKFLNPIIAANMPAVINDQLASALSNRGTLGVLHRFNDIETAVQEYQAATANTNQEYPIGVSIGAKETSKRRFEALYDKGARIFCVDVAHGHHINVKNILKWIQNEMFRWARNERNKLVLIAGNVATMEGIADLTDWGADAAKIGLGPGSACTTRLETGVGVPQLHCIETAFAQTLAQDIPIKLIADGGCNNTGDISKALAAGADMVMLGRMFAGTDESPGNFITIKGRQHKLYYGSASFENKGVLKHIEGIDFLVERKGTVHKVIDKIEDGLRSAFSYVNANDLNDFHNQTQFLDISEGSRVESKFE